MTIEIKTKGVSFNVLDPDQKAMYDHAMKRKNFSSYVKRLIQRDIDNRFKPTSYQMDTAVLDDDLDDDLMNGLI